MYIDGFVIPVPTASRQDFIDHATPFDEWLLEMGATRVLECWGDDVPDGKLTDFRRAVQATGQETVMFSWVEWPDKATRDAAHKTMMDPANCDPRAQAASNAMPFDGKRMIVGGFTPIVTLGK